MGFFDNYEDAGGGNFVGKEEKAELANSGDSFVITKVKYNANGKFGPQFVLDLTLDGEERRMSFSAESVESRDRMLYAMEQFLSEGGEPVEVVLVRNGNSYLIHDAVAADA